MTEFKIEKRIPTSSLIPKYPFADMEIDDAFVVSWERAESARQAAYYWGKKHNMKFGNERVDGGYRIWRKS